MRYDLAAMWRRARNPRRREVVLRPVNPPAMFATDLYRSAYMPAVDLWEAALPGIEAEYARSLAEITTDSPADIGRQLDSADSEFQRLVLTLRLRTEQWALRVEAWQRGRWRGAVLSATGVDIGTLIGAGDMRSTIGAAIERNVSLIKSVSDQTRARIGDAVFRGLNQRLPADTVAKQIREAVAMSRRRARNIAADQLVKISSSLAEERAREAGLTEYVWVHSGKAHPRPEHVARDGKRYELGSPSGDTPGALPFCGCTSRAVVSLDG